MNPNIARNGKSFRGAGRYYLHDKAPARDGNEPVVHPKTDQRVSFIDTRNLVNDDPEQAIDEMWATAAMQDGLKEAAGIKRGGRKCDDPVKSVSLSWHPSETPTHDQMIEAADGFLKHMGWQEHQVLMVGHDDTPHKHVHLIINRVHPDTGRTLNDWQEQKRSQAWALEYEKEHGRIWCEKRLETEKERDTAIPRKDFDVMREASVPFVEDQRSKAERDKDDWKELRAEQRDERIAFFDDGKQAFKDARSAVYQEVREDYRPDWREYFRDKAEREVEAEQASTTAIGRALFFAKAGELDKAWEAFGNRDAVRDAVAAEFDGRREALRTEQVRDLRERQTATLDALRVEREEAYRQLLDRQSVERAELRIEQAQGERVPPGERTPEPRERPPANENGMAPVPGVAKPQPEKAATKAPEIDLAAELPVAALVPTVEPTPSPVLRDPTDVREADRGAETMITGASDAGAGMIGSLATYVADQLAETFAPTPPEVREAQAKALAKAEAERPPPEPENPFLKHQSAADNKARTEKDEKDRDDYWIERAREREP